ncbi:MAG: hypothetical protein AAF526_00740 [Pseudomonadota bacterium]
MPCLGFSDLAEDEALIVAIYRDWRAANSPKEMSERAIAAQLSHDTIHRILPVAFRTFRQITPANAPPCGPGDLLSSQEERLLDVLSEKLRSTPPSRHDRDDARQQHRIRHSAEIPGSGLDELTSKIHAASLRVAVSL